MNEITPRFGLPLDFPRKERDLEASKFQLALNESNARGPDGQRQGPVRPQSGSSTPIRMARGAPGTAQAARAVRAAQAVRAARAGTALVDRPV